MHRSAHPLPSPCPTLAALVALTGLIATAAGAAAQPRVRLDFDVSNEGGPGEQRTITFAIELIPFGGRAVSATYVVTNGAAPGIPAATGGPTCTGNTDYIAASGTVHFVPSVGRREVPVTICGDAMFEQDERLTFRITSLTHATMSDPDSAVVGVIVNDDAKPEITVTIPNQGLVTEGTGNSVSVPVSITLSAPHHGGVSLKLARGGTARRAPQCGGMTDIVTGSDTVLVSWVAGSNAPMTVPVVVCGDTNDEENDTFELTAAQVVNAEVSPANRMRRLVIFDNDPAPVIDVSDAQVQEGQTAAVTVTLSAASDRDIEVTLKSAEGGAVDGAIAATLGNACGGTVDFVHTSRRVTIPAGKTTSTFEVITCSNTDFSSNPSTLPGPGYREVFKAVASAPTNATVGKAEGVVTVRDP